MRLEDVCGVLSLSKLAVIATV